MREGPAEVPKPRFPVHPSTTGATTSRCGPTWTKNDGLRSDAVAKPCARSVASLRLRYFHARAFEGDEKGPVLDPSSKGPWARFGAASVLDREAAKKNADFFRVRAQFGPKSGKLEKVGFRVIKRTPRRAPEPSRRSPESARYRRPAEHSRSDASRRRF